MKNLPIKILNYFATYTETRFNFGRLINYKWSNDELTLDLSLFPEFQKTLLQKVKEGDASPLIIGQGDYSIHIPKEMIIVEIKKILKDKCNSSYLDECIQQEFRFVAEQNELFVLNDDGELEIKDNGEENRCLLEQQIALSQQQGIHEFNLALRRQLEVLLYELQVKIIDQKKDELNIESVPTSIFGIINYATQHFEQIKKLGKKFSNSDEFINDISEYFSGIVKDIVIYDLYYNLRKYADFTKLGTVYLFFHVMEREDKAYPLYFIEIEYRASNSNVTLIFPRNLVYLNTPAINYFKFNNVLTVPRAALLSTSEGHLGAIETFFQNQYGFQTPFILEPCFSNITHADKSYPVIKNRIGLQVIMNEDRKLLDYSELMTAIDAGKASQFVGFVDQYIRGAVPNYQKEVDEKYKEQYTFKNPLRYIPDGPIPINNPQRRILMALEKEKNRTIVVDGPPGTGKSHAIAAITYWANEKGKSVVITSHKQEALNVIDRMLTDKYKDLHPLAKPSIVRMDKETGSSNNLQNTLTNAVIGAANERVLDYNEEAIESDRKKISSKLTDKITRKLDQAMDYENHVRANVEFEHLNEFFKTDPEIAEVLQSVSSITRDVNLEVIDKFVRSGGLNIFYGTSLDEYLFLIDHKDKTPDFLEACEKLHQVPKDLQNLETSVSTVPIDFRELVETLKRLFKQDVELSKLSSSDAATGIFNRILGKAPKKEELDTLLAQLHGLKYVSLLDEIAKVLEISKEKLTIMGISSGLDRIEFSISMRKYQALLSGYRVLPGNGNKEISEIYEVFKRYAGKDRELLNEELYKALQALFLQYGSVLEKIGVHQNSLDTLAKLEGHDSHIERIWQWIRLHYHLSQKSQLELMDWKDVKDYYTVKQKELEHLNDNRLSNFNNHLGDMERIKISFDGGKRFTLEESRVLLDNISCIIAEPSTISKHFPMEEDLIDILIIDEASQVSIADSISLLLRAKQVVIFGDEYQYGAVSATNVSRVYSANYFSEIVDAYVDDYNTHVPDEAKRELINEVSKEIPADDQESDVWSRPEDGTVLWLKTFNIRTSTLTFAKAIANYTVSLKEHFRSFPEIIGYSNDFFYKEAQMELIINRIRTKPIGEVLQFIKVDTLGRSAPNTNLDEVEAICNDLEKRLNSGFKGTTGIITSFKEQQLRTEQMVNERFNMAALRRDHKLSIWFVGDVQGEERDLVYYSFVEDKSINNANLASIYPVIGGTADNIRSLKMQRLNVGFSRAKDTMIFVHSQPIEQFSNTRLGDALKYYSQILETNKKNDFFVEDDSIFDSPMEKKLYALLLETRFVKDRRDNIKIIPQFEIGKYISAEYKTYIPKYRTDFLLVYADGGKEKTLILEYDGLEYHFKNPHEVNQFNFSQSYLDYDTSRRLELESYGYSFLRINKFNLRPRSKEETEADVLNSLLEEKLGDYVQN